MGCGLDSVNNHSGCGLVLITMGVWSSANNHLRDPGLHAQQVLEVAVQVNQPLLGRLSGMRLSREESFAGKVRQAVDGETQDQPLVQLVKLAVSTKQCRQRLASGHLYLVDLEKKR